MRSTMRRRAVMLGAFVAVALGCGGLGTGSGTKVVVVRHGTIDAANDLAVAQGVADILTDRGFLVQVVAEALPDDSADPAMDARWAASGYGAANAVLLSLASREVRPGIEPGTAHHEVSVDTAVVNLDPTLEVARQRLVFASEDVGPEPVARRTARHWVEASGGFAVRHLFVTPEVGAVMMGESVPLDEMSAANELRKRERQVAEAAERAYGYDAYCEEQAARLGSFSAEGLTCVGDPCGGASLLGVAGSEVLVQDARRELWFGVPVPDHATWSEPPERVLAVDPTSGDERVLVEAQNLYGLGHVRPGAAVGTMDWFTASGHEAIVGFDIASGTPTVTTMLGKGQRSDLAAAAPDGSAVAYCLQDSGGCFLDDGSDRRELPGLRAADWVVTDAGPRLVGQDGDELVAVAPDGAVARGPLGGARLREVVVARDGGIELVVVDDGACVRWVVDAASLAPSARDELPGCPWHTSPAPDGALVAIAEATAGGGEPEGDSEVVRWSPGTETWDVLTSGPYREEFPFVMDDGRVVFNRRLEPAPKVYDTEVYRRVICSLEP